MALPPHLRRYDGLIDLLVDALLAEATADESPSEKPAAPGRALPRVEVEHGENNPFSQARAI
jgi:hypothetical protein